MLPRNYFSDKAGEARYRVQFFVALWACAIIFAPGSARAGGLCENEAWQCAALQATVGHRTVNSIHDPTHQDPRTLDGGIADISVKVGQILTLRWNGEPDHENKQKARPSFKIISSKSPPIGCSEPDWGDDDDLNGTADVDFSECNQGRNFVITFKVNQGRSKADEKVARIRVHVLRKDQNADGTGDSSSVASAAKEPALKPDEESDFSKLLNY